MTFNRRLNDLERKVHPEPETKYFVCWCNREDGLHNEDCQANHLQDQDGRLVVFQMIEVKYNRSDPIPEEEA